MRGLSLQAIPRSGAKPRPKITRNIAITSLAMSTNRRWILRATRSSRSSALRWAPRRRGCRRWQAGSPATNSRPRASRAFSKVKSRDSPALGCPEEHHDEGSLLLLDKNVNILILVDASLSDDWLTITPPPPIFFVSADSKGLSVSTSPL